MSLDWLDKKHSDAVVGYFVDRFGIPAEEFAGLALFRKNEYIYALRAEARDAADALDTLDAGLPVAKTSRSGALKPATRGIQVFGRKAAKNYLDLTPEELRALVEGRSLAAVGEMTGIVLLRLGGATVGTGLCRDGRLVGQMPRSLTQYLDFSQPGELL